MCDSKRDGVDHKFWLPSPHPSPTAWPGSGDSICLNSFLSHILAVCLIKNCYLSQNCCGDKWCMMMYCEKPVLGLVHEKCSMFVHLCPPIVTCGVPDSVTVPWMPQSQIARLCISHNIHRILASQKQYSMVANSRDSGTKHLVRN